MEGHRPVRDDGTFRRPEAPSPIISTQIVRHIRDCFELSGLDTAAILRACDVDPAVIDLPDRAILLDSYMRFFELSAAAIGNQHFGLHAARLMGVDGLGALSFLFLSAPTLRQAFQAFAENLAAMQEATFNSFVEGRRSSHFTYLVPHAITAPMRQDAEYSIAVMYQLMRRYAGGNHHPLEVHFEHERCGSYRLYEDYFRCTVLFEQPYNRIYLDNAVLDVGSSALSVGVFPIADEYLKSRLKVDQQPRSLAQRTADMLLPLALTDLPTLEEAAARLQLSRSSLVRGLRREGTRFGQLVTERRMTFARHALLNDRRSVTEIALAAGYAESASFCRAFAARHGDTPARWRRRSQSA